MAVSRYLLDVLTRGQVLLEGLKESEARKLGPVLAKYEQEIVTLLGQTSGSFSDLSAPEVNALLRRVLNAGRKVMTPWLDDFFLQLEEATKYEADFTARALEAGIASPVDVRRVSAHDAWRAALEHPLQVPGVGGELLLEPFVRGWTESTLESVEGAIRIGHAQGQTVDELVRTIRGTKAANYQNGIISGMRRSVEALVRTSVQHVSNAGRDAVFEENPDLVTGVRWIATLDNRTCQICRSLDQRTYKTGEGPRPPIHIGDRCTTIGEMSDGIDLVGGKATRASKGDAGGAQVPASQTYYGWLKTQPASFQDEAIGPARGRLLRNGGLSADEFARLNLGRNFTPRTLDEMKALAPEAFNEAGVEP